MSYDLFFFTNGKRLAADDFANYFKDRPNYQDSSYENEDTGVHFGFELADRDEGGGDEPQLWATFYLNYGRPHFFGLEAVGEVEAFIRHFGLAIEDPQLDGMDSGPFTREGFLKGWNKGNEYGYRAMLQEESDTHVPTFPTKGLQLVWKWNYTRNKRSAGFPESHLIPLVQLVDVHGKVRTACFWFDGGPGRLPRTDLVYVGRHELRPHRQSGSEESDMCVVPWKTLAPLFGNFPKGPDPVESVDLNYENPPEEIADFIRGLKPTESPPRIYRGDMVLNAELVQQARGR